MADKFAEPGCGEERETADELIRDRKEIGFKLDGVRS